MEQELYHHTAKYKMLLSGNVEVKEFVPENIIIQDYDVWHLQPILFAIESFEQLEQGFKEWTKKAGLV